MTTSMSEPQEARALQVSVTDDELAVDLADGRTVMVPLAWYPRLVHGTRQERKRWRLIGRGVGIHWPDLDEDISVEGLLAGRPSGESQRSLKRWLQGREAARPKQAPAADAHAAYARLMRGIALPKSPVSRVRTARRCAGAYPSLSSSS